MTIFKNILNHQNIVFGNTEKGYYWQVQNIENQYCYFCKNTSTFTGKEKDPETGYSYFGARYLEHDLMAGWLSVDPMADKYPSISPYAYCARNPIIFVDPNGMIIDSTSLTDKIKATIQSNPTFANACDALAKDPENTYSFNKWDKPKIENDRQINGIVTFDGEKVYINYIETSDNFALFEEVGHAQQVISGDIGFAEVVKDGILQWGTIGLDCQDEINAKQWAATAAGRKKTIFSIDDLISDGYNVDKLGSTSRTAYQDYKAYLNRNPGLTEAEFNDNGMIQHSYFHFIKKEK